MPHSLIQFLQAHGEEFVALRRDLHRHPELGLHEVRTSQRIANCLERWGCEVQRGLATTGVVGTLRRGTGRRLGLRADMDALPLEEATGKPWASAHDGVMHACGHDGHTAMLLAAADRFSGTLHLIFQPADEHPGGAKLMIEQGLFERFPCDAIFAMHNMPGIPQTAQLALSVRALDAGVRDLLEQRCPGRYLLIGNGDGPGGCMVHNPGHDFNDDNVALAPPTGRCWPNGS